MVLRGLAVDDVCGWHPHGCDNAGRRHVPAVATHHAPRRVVSEHGNARPHRAVLRTCYRPPHFLHHHHRRRESRNMDIPPALCGRWIRTSPLFITCHVVLTTLSQVESFIPLWEWDLPKTKAKKKKGDKKAKKSSAEKHKDNGGAYIEEVAGSEDSRPQSRNARIEEVEDEDA